MPLPKGRDFIRVSAADTPARHTQSVLSQAPVENIRPADLVRRGKTNIFKPPVRFPSMKGWTGESVDGYVGSLAQRRSKLFQRLLWSLSERFQSILGLGTGWGGQETNSPNRERPDSIAQRVHKIAKGSPFGAMTKNGFEGHQRSVNEKTTALSIRTGMTGDPSDQSAQSTHQLNCGSSKEPKHCNPNKSSGWLFKERPRGQPPPRPITCDMKHHT